METVTAMAPMDLPCPVQQTAVDNSCYLVGVAVGVLMNSLVILITLGDWGVVGLPHRVRRYRRTVGVVLALSPMTTRSCATTI